MAEPGAGDRLDQFELEELLARSGMASIFKAKDTETGATVALKIPHLHFEGDVVFSQRFRREAEIGLRLEHPGIVRVFPPPKKRSRVYLVMELVEGKSLRALLDEERPFTPTRALDIARQLTEAIVYLHANGVVHRDLKPENVLVLPDGRLKLLDFGIALDEHARRLTWFGLSSSVGTPDYMAPEQAQGRRGDVRTDVYAIGTMLFEMLTGELPFTAGNAQTLLRTKGSENPRSPRDIVPALDPKLEEIVLHAIERQPRDRYPRAADLLADLVAPERVVPRDRSEILARRKGFLGLPERVAVGMLVVVVVGFLFVLIGMTHRHGTPGQQPEPMPAPGRP